MATNGKVTAKDYKTDQEVRWCPGCGDYAILAALQSFMPELEFPKEKIVFVSGIGCAARFPYYMETYGIPKGQYSPTSPLGTRTKSTPMGSLDWPFNPLSIAIGAEATFVARAIDTDRAHLTEVLRAAANHRGSSFVEIFQNCNIFNDGAFDFVRDDKTNRIYLEHDQPIRFGENGEKGVRQLRDGTVEVFEGEGEPLVHDARMEQPSLAFALSRLTQDTSGATPIGIFRDVEAPVYDELMSQQLEESLSGRGEGELEALLRSGETWSVS